MFGNINNIEDWKRVAVGNRLFHMADALLDVAGGASTASRMRDFARSVGNDPYRVPTIYRHRVRLLVLMADLPGVARACCHIDEQGRYI